LKKEGKMKKLLLATSALVMTSGFAAAEITTSGSARMGLVYDGALGEAFFSSRVRIVFTASGETDSGLTFGAEVRADQQGGNNNDFGCFYDNVGLVNLCADKDGDTNGDSTVYISGAFGKLTMGDVGGAADALVGQVSGVGYGPIDSLQEIGFVGTTKTAVYYEYSTGGFTVGLGAGQLYDVDNNVDTNDELSIAVKYATDTYSIALGYEDSTVVDALHLGGSATFGDATFKARITDADLVDDTLWAVSLDYVIGATTVTGFYTDFGNSIYGGLEDTQHIGLGASYDLGGNATVAGGIVTQQNDILSDETFADLGLKFKF
jgi:outer membrane protein OmpU